MQAQKTGNPAVRNGLIFGLILAVVDIANVIIQWAAGSYTATIDAANGTSGAPTCWRRIIAWLFSVPYSARTLLRCRNEYLKSHGQSGLWGHRRSDNRPHWRAGWRCC